MIQYWFRLVTFLLLGVGVFAAAETTVEFKRTLPLSPTDHIVLDVAVPEGSLNISYARAGEISVLASARAADDGGDVPQDFFNSSLTVERAGNTVKVRFTPNSKYGSRAFRIAYTIGVPYWLEVNSSVENGKQTVSGVMGPVKVACGKGDIRATYITSTLEARTGAGNINVIRVGAAAVVETGSGNINLKDIGPGSTAIVRKGTGRIEMDGISGSFTARTDAGELDAKGGIFDAWDLNSISGNIRIGVPPESKYELDAITRSGQLSVENEDIDLPQAGQPRECHQKINGGGKGVRVRSDSGSIFIQ